MARTEDRRTLPVDEDPERVAIPGDDPGDDGSVVTCDSGRCC
jgi:hypothetical protein